MRGRGPARLFWRKIILELGIARTHGSSFEQVLDHKCQLLQVNDHAHVPKIKIVAKRFQVLETTGLPCYTSKNF